MKIYLQHVGDFYICLINITTFPKLIIIEIFVYFIICSKSFILFIIFKFIQYEHLETLDIL